MPAQTRQNDCSAYAVRRHWMGRAKGGLALALLCFTFQLPGLFALPPIDRDEARFATTTRNMLAGDSWRDWVVPQFDRRPRINKPPLTYWLQAPLVALTGVDVRDPVTVPAPLPPESPRRLLTPNLADGGIWAYRLAGVLASTAAAVLTWRIGLLLFAAPAAWLGGLLLGTCALVMFDVRQARADQHLLAFTTLAQLALCHLWLARRQPLPRRWLGAFWIAIALGTLTKGPITPAVCGLTALALAAVGRDWAWFRRLHVGWGALFVIALIVPWIVAVGAAVGWFRIGASVFQETLMRAARGVEGHSGPPGYYLALLPVLFWPASLALAPALGLGFARGIRFVRMANAKTLRARLARLIPHPGRRPEFFLLAWLVPGWLMFEVAGTKLPHYTLPLYPALALLAGRALFALSRGWEPLLKGTFGRMLLAGWFLLAEIIVVGTPVTLLILCDMSAYVWAAGATLVCVIAAQMSLVLTRQALIQRRTLRAQRYALVAALLTTLGLFQFLLPNAEMIWLSPRVLSALRAIEPAPNQPLADLGFEADSLVFLTRGRVERLEPYRLYGWQQQTTPNTLLVANDELSTDRTPAATIGGFDYSKGRWVTIRLFATTERSSSKPADN